MKFKQKITLALAGIALTASNLVAAQSGLLNASYDVAREFYKDYNGAFAAHYKKTTGKDIKIDQAHGGSSAQARAVNDGLDADVVTMNTTTDIDFLASTGVVAKDWAKRFPNNAAPTTSTMLFLVPGIIFPENCHINQQDRDLTKKVCQFSAKFTPSVDLHD